MIKKSQIGVCMDYSIAYLLEEKNEERVITIIEANENDAEEEPKNLLRARRKNSAFFKQIFEIVRDFDSIQLFGPAALKKELLHRIKAHRLFNIEVTNNDNQDNITENDKIEFINNYFGN